MTDIKNSNWRFIFLKHKKMPLQYLHWAAGPSEKKTGTWKDVSRKNKDLLTRAS